MRHEKKLYWKLKRSDKRCKQADKEENRCRQDMVKQRDILTKRVLPSKSVCCQTTKSLQSQNQRERVGVWWWPRQYNEHTDNRQQTSSFFFGILFFFLKYLQQPSVTLSHKPHPHQSLPVINLRVGASLAVSLSFLFVTSAPVVCHYCPNPKKLIQENANDGGVPDNWNYENIKGVTN